MIPGLSNVKKVVAGLLTGLVVGGLGGYYVKTKFVEATRVAELERKIDSMERTRAEDARQAAISQAKSLLLAQEIATRNETAKAIKKEIKKYAPSAPVVRRSDAGTPDQAAGSGIRLVERPLSCGPADFVLTRGELWLLDLAREGRGIDSPPDFRDGEGTQPADVTREEFLENDLEIVERFYRLKAKHDALVDYVSDLQRRQRERLSAKAGFQQTD